MRLREQTRYNSLKVMENKHLVQLREVVTDFFKDDEVKIILFGSRARGESSYFSDVDIGVLPSSNFDTKKIPLLEEKMGEFNIPFKVEIINLLETSSELRQQALKDAVVWKNY